MTPEITFDGTYTRQELLEFDRAARKALGSSSLYANVGCYGAAAVAVFILGIVQWHKGNESGAIQWFALFAIAAALAPVQWWSTRRSFGRHPHLNQPISGTLREDAFDLRTPTSTSTTAWSGIASAFCNDDYLILIAPDQTTYGISRAFFRTSEDFAQASELVRRHVPNVPPGRRIRLFRVLVWTLFLVLAFVVWSLYRSGV